MFCGQCGTKIDDEDSFCNNCGNERSTINNWDGIYKSVTKFSKRKRQQKRLAKDEEEKQKKKKPTAKSRQQDLEKELKNQTQSPRQQELEEYEKKYLKELTKKKRQGKKMSAKDIIKENQEKERIEQGTIAELIRTLSPKDYIVLESLRRDDWQLSLKLGTMELMAITEKLFRCGLIKRLDREPTFDEKEKLLKFMDSPAYKQHVKRVERLATPEFKERVKAYMKKLGFESEYDLTELTGKGKELLKKKIKELKSEWGKLVAIYKTKDGQKLKQEIDNYRFDFPLMLYMGFSSGFIMSAMFNSMGIGMGGYLAEDPMMTEPLMGPIVMELEGFEKSPVTYEQFMESWDKDGYYDENGNWVDTSADGSADSGSTDSGDSGGGEGGFMDGGANVGF